MLTKNDCQAIKGMSIMCIVLHNYCHFLPLAANENEFSFSEENYMYFLTHIFSSDFIIQLFSFLGHLGVPSFVFLTGYGLAKKYNGINNVKRINFIWKHYMKFFLPMLLGMLGYILIHQIVYGELWNNWIWSFLTQMTLINNLTLLQGVRLLPGPYWYFGLTMQLYIIYILIVYKRSYNIIFFITALSLFFIFLLGSHEPYLILYKHNFTGWLLPFTIGLFLGNYDKRVIFSRRVWLTMVLLSGASIILFSYNYFTWIFIPVISILFFIGLNKCLSGQIFKFFCSIGSISMYMFFIHPHIREIFLTVIPSEYLRWGLFPYIITVLFISICISWVKRFLKKT